MASAKNKVVISTEVPIPFRDEVDARAAAEGRKRSELIVRALRFYMANAAAIKKTDEELPPVITEKQDTTKKRKP